MFARNQGLHKRKAFTLTEVLMVVIILSLFAGFALPVYSKAVRKNKERTAVNNLRLLHAAALIYWAKNGTLWDPGVAWESNLSNINAALGTSVVDTTGLMTYRYRVQGGSPPTMLRLDVTWTEGGDTSKIHFNENVSTRVTDGPCCEPSSTYCLIVPNC